MSSTLRLSTRRTQTDNEYCLISYATNGRDRAFPLQAHHSLLRVFVSYAVSEGCNSRKMAKVMRLRGVEPLSVTDPRVRFVQPMGSDDDNRYTTGAFEA